MTTRSVSRQYLHRFEFDVTSNTPCQRRAQIPIYHAVRLISGSYSLHLRRGQQALIAVNLRYVACTPPCSPLRLPLPSYTSNGASISPRLPAPSTTKSHRTHNLPHVGGAINCVRVPNRKPRCMVTQLPPRDVFFPRTIVLLLCVIYVEFNSIFKYLVGDKTLRVVIKSPEIIDDTSSLIELVLFLLHPGGVGRRRCHNEL